MAQIIQSQVEMIVLVEYLARNTFRAPSTERVGRELYSGKTQTAANHLATLEHCGWARRSEDGGWILDGVSKIAASIFEAEQEQKTAVSRRLHAVVGRAA